MTLAQLGKILATPGIVPDLKVQRALNLDGGSSSAFWFAGENGRLFDFGAEDGAEFRGGGAEISSWSAADAPRMHATFVGSTESRLSRTLRYLRMRTFGGFRSNDEFFYGEVRGDSVHVLKKPYWLGLEFDGRVFPLGDLQIDLPVAPSKVIAVGLNYADHIKEMQRTPLGTPLIWFKAPTSLLPHGGTIEIAFPEHQTDFEAGTRNRDRDDRQERAGRATRSNTFSVTRSAKTSAIAICRNPRNNSDAANRSTPTRRSDRLFTRRSMSAICRSRFGRTAR